MKSTGKLLQHNVINKWVPKKGGGGAFLKQTARFYSPPKKLVSVGSVTNYYNVS
jgi:hypothetical protein